VSDICDLSVAVENPTIPQTVSTSQQRREEVEEGEGQENKGATKEEIGWR
jgi:hypothetical protein